MMISPSSPILKGVFYEDLLEYLHNTGWQLVPSINNKWIVFEGASDIEGNPLEIVLPQDPHIVDIQVHIANAINTLCAVADAPLEVTVAKIKYHNQDVLRVRNPETGETDALSLKIAAQQVFELKQLVAYSACSEDEPKPYFMNSQLPSARSMVEKYRFGHTFRGSFGFTIETPRISKQRFGVQKSLIPNMVNDQEYVPLARRVMERIVRGLLVTQEATETRDVQKIVREYKRAFNSNMCRAIVNMSIGKKQPLEYTIAWSSVMPPSDETLRDPGVIRLDYHSYEYLAHAAEILSELEPEEVTITGLVTDLSARDNPLGLDTSRSIIIRWHDKSKGTIHKVYVVLEKEDYLKAIKAHQEWRPVTITGTLQRVKRNWKIINYHDFRTE